MKPIKHISLWLFLSLLTLQVAKAQNTTPPQFDEQLIQHVKILNELSERRQINTFFKNDLAEATGYMLDVHLTPHYAGIMIPPTNQWAANLGTKMDGHDEIKTGTDGHLPITNGTFEWNIPQFFIGPAGVPKQFGTSKHYAANDNTGKMVLSKGVNGNTSLTVSADLLTPTTPFIGGDPTM